MAERLGKHPADRSLDVASLQQQLRDFAKARDWERFHSPKNLAMALAVESGELLEIFQWLTGSESHELSDADRARAAEEIADLQIYLLRLADVIDVPVAHAVDDKIRANALKYPVSLSKGNATKYSRRRGS